MALNIHKLNRIDVTTAEQKLIDGLNKHAALIPSMVINGASHTAKDIIATLQSRIDSAKAALSTRATWQAAIRTDRTLRATTKTYVSGVRQGLLVAFGAQVDTLADFGLAARAKHVATPETKLAAAAKAKATRSARHTMGSKQKAAIKGVVAPAGVSAPAVLPPLVPPAPTALTPTHAIAASPPAAPVEQTRNP